MVILQKVRFYLIRQTLYPLRSLQRISNAQILSLYRFWATKLATIAKMEGGDLENWRKTTEEW